MSVSMLLLSGAMTAAASFRVFTPGEHPDKKKARQAAFNHRVEDSFTDRHIAGLFSHKVDISLYSGRHISPPGISGASLPGLEETYGEIPQRQDAVRLGGGSQSSLP